MRQNQWKKAGLTVLSAIFMGSLSLAAAGTGIPALAATKDVAVTEYDEAALVKFKDNTLEYWEIPGLIERYNADYQNQLQKYYYNPGGSTGLTKDQMLALAADLRAEADELENDADDLKNDSSTRSESKGQTCMPCALMRSSWKIPQMEKRTAAQHSADFVSREMRRQKPQGKRCALMRHQRISMILLS